MMKAKPSFDAMVTNTDNCAPIQIDNAPVAQLDRVLGYEPSGREFESLQARHTELRITFFRGSFLFLT